MSIHITFYGHSCFMIKQDGVSILFDPFITGNDKASDIDIKTLKPDVILLSHGHADHVLDAEAIAKNSGAKIIANYEVAQWFQNKAVENTHPVNHGGTVHLGKGVHAKYVAAVHTSSMPDGSYGGEAGGFVIASSSGRYYYSGDTALTMDMKLIAMDGGVDFAFLCLGDNFTMGVNDAIKASEFVDTSKVIGMHFDTFEPIAIDHDHTHKAFANAGVELTLMEIGESITIE